jgi:hypothetical protein
MIECGSAFKRKVLDLLEEDREFRVTLGALTGFKELLEKLESHDCKFNEILERLDRHEARLEALATELKALRMDFNTGMHAFQLRLDALGARWGIFAEHTFREGMKYCGALLWR